MTTITNSQVKFDTSITDKAIIALANAVAENAKAITAITNHMHHNGNVYGIYIEAQKEQEDLA